MSSNTIKGIKKVLVKTLKYSGITIVAIIALLFILPALFPKTVSEQIKRWANESITSELNFSKARLTFFSHFPTLTLSLKDVSLTGSAPFANDTLLAAEEVALGIDLSSIFKEQIKIDRIYVTDGNIKVLVNEAGQPNYNIYKSTGDTSAVNDSSSASLKLARIEISKTALIYKDASIPFELSVKELDYIGKGDLSAAVFDLASNITMTGTTLAYDNEPYLQDKDLKAKLLTEINTHSLALHFNKNDLFINKLPLAFVGKFEFLKNGYFLDFSLKTPVTDFGNLFTALPPKLVKWVEKRSVRGNLTMGASLKGAYVSEDGLAPTLAFDMTVKDGSLESRNSSAKAKNFLFDFHVKLPSLNTDSLTVDMDTLSLAVADKYIRGGLHIVGLNEPSVKGQLQGLLDLEKLNGLFTDKEVLALKGIYEFKFRADGQYRRGQNPDSFRPDTVITSFPVFSYQSSLRNGYFKYGSLPVAAEQISFNVNAGCSDGLYNNIYAKIEDINAVALSNYIKGHVHINGLKNLPVEAALSSKINLADIAKIVPLEDYSVNGLLDLDITCKGNYNQSKGQFPVTRAFFKVNNGSIKTPHYPAPLKDIVVDAEVVSTNGTTRDVSIKIKPVSFSFEGEPFLLKTDLRNLDNIHYEIASKGTLNLTNIYKAFAVTGYDVKGRIKADFDLRGNQADATAGKINRLHNSGTLVLDSISVMTEMYPKPIFINKGQLHFKNDLLVADKLVVKYGKTEALLTGYFKNMIAYGLQDNATLWGNLNLKSKLVDVAEWTAFSEPGSNAGTTGNSGSSGVIMLPKTMNFTFNANVAVVDYDGILLKNAQSEVLLQNGELLLKNTKFRLIDAPISMNASYKSQNPLKASFTYQVQADSFAIEKAYKEIALFREMATSAKGIKGIVGLNYSLAGHLDENMSPIYASLKGGGELTLKDIKIKGFKLLNAVGKATNRDSLGSKADRVKGVTIKTSLANNILTIERTKLKIAGFRPRFEGQVSLDGRLNLKGRLGLPPFGIFGIPFNVTGNSENPKVKLKRGKANDELKPDDYDDDVVLPAPDSTKVI
ncbi:AsmA family protein [Polluticaenibacter yanchengensis]|uniref:AsmA family protein n=1 Tax=Polluticaenibacter yanchengensis TaxID=3014562 RepID=A0ABT4UN59_9BACT|nr:AsmA family protein [Chitinophagaceae bacterium LY-5]